MQTTGSPARKEFNFSQYAEKYTTVEELHNNNLMVENVAGYMLLKNTRCIEVLCIHPYQQSKLTSSEKRISQLHEFKLCPSYFISIKSYVRFSTGHHTFKVYLAIYQNIHVARGEALQKPLLHFLLRVYRRPLKRTRNTLIHLKLCKARSGNLVRYGTQLDLSMINALKHLKAHSDCFWPSDMKENLLSQIANLPPRIDTLKVSSLASKIIDMSQS